LSQLKSELRQAKSRAEAADRETAGLKEELGKREVSICLYLTIT
jgi:hypothetical protein